MQNNMRRYTFSGHESFFCKSLWLKKGYDAVKNGVSFNSPDAVAQLGVGKNMVSSIRYWMKSFGLLNDNGLTPFANYIFEDKNGKDPYIEDIGTIWLLHYQLLRERVASLYYLTFYEFKREKNEFSRDQLLSFVRRKCFASGQKNVFNENTVKKDITTLLHMYVAPSDIKSTEEFTALLIDLDLLKRKEDVFSFTEISPSFIPELIILYAMIDMKGESNTLSIDAMQEITLAFGLSILDFVGIVRRLVKMFPEKIVYTDNSGIKNVQFLENLEPYSILDIHYNKS